MLAAAARALSMRGVSANALTSLSFLAGMLAAAAIAFGAFGAALVLFLVGRLFDGLDGAVARISAPTDRGGYLDIVSDFAVYAAIPLAFAWYDPAANGLAAATLLAAIVLNGSAFLTFAALAEKRRLETDAQGQKSIYFLAGLAEGTETVVVYGAMCLWPSEFGLLAFLFAALCLVSALGRIWVAWHSLD
jgi:phosphatidylglycerophosphate synthase